ncbi:MAG: DUF2911 domain-containing protein [Ignavibacteriaceae bacterium]
MKSKSFQFFSLFMSMVFIYTAADISAQQFSTPRTSPVASVSQTVGVTDVTINYCRPGVKDRVIWGELVPYNEVWRTGANEVTSIVFSDPVKINGNELPAGTYGIHTIPAQDEWTIIFSKNTQVGGSSQYKEENAALKIKVKPETSEFNERLIFTFTDVTDNLAKVNLAWEKIKVPFTIETATQDITLAKANSMIDWGIPLQAAAYCLQNDVNLDQAINWINASVIINENYWNMRIKAQLLAKAGKKEEAVSAMEKAIEHGKKMENKPFDMDNMEKMLSEWKS